MLLSAKWVDTMRDIIDEAPAPGVRRRPGARRTGHRLPRPPRRPRLDAAQAAADGGRPPDHRPPGRRHGVGQRPHQHRRDLPLRCRPRHGRGPALPDCADPCTGAASRSRWARSSACRTRALDIWPTGLETVREAGFTLLALTPDDRAKALDEVAPHRMDRVALMLGAEGDGLSRRALAASDEWVRIPMSHGVDSLNVGAAAAVAFYAVATGRPSA
ncbi:rRNA methyltransferase [Streptomyces thinghirensis]|nr:rRNA methyltransferase [Streptomyces thinghirensis]